MNIQETLECQRASFLKEGFVTAESRIDRLVRGYRMIGENQDAIMEACNADFGNHSMIQAQMSEVMATMDNLKHGVKNVKSWMKNEKRKVAFPMNMLGARARVEYQPKGVVGNIAVWNFPVYVSIGALASIFAAGNRAMVKFSEFSPETGALLEDLISKYFDETECVGFNGGVEVGAEFASAPFDHLVFTGSPTIGRHILQAAVANLTPVTLELGGKSPVIVSRSYELKKAAERLMAGKALNMGQACLGPDYTFVPKEHTEAFISEIEKCWSEMFPTTLGNPDYTAMINATHYKRMGDIIQDARDKGGDVRVLNPANEDFSTQDENILRFPMTLVVDPSEDMRAMQEELFGPVLCIRSYDTFDQCIDYINAHPRPLGLYYFGNDAKEESRVLTETTSGGVAINDVLVQASCDDLPFGGIGNSGMGNYHGWDGFLTFSHKKAVYHQTKLDIVKLAGMLPPYGDACKKQLDKLTRVKKL